MENADYQLRNRGIFFVCLTDSCAELVSVFISASHLASFACDLRENFKISGLEESIDKRYAISTAHSTVLRFRKRIKNKAKLIEILEKYLNHNFGKFEVGNLDLVSNDWWLREQFVKQLHSFKLR